MRYLLLNKDIVWLEFHCEQNEYLETAALEDCWHTDLRPFGYTNLTDFLERRKAPNTGLISPNCSGNTAATRWKGIWMWPTPFP